MAPVRVAHLSDLHVIASISPLRLANKRFTGWLNLRFRRREIHRPAIAAAVLREIRRLEFDHVAITGDVTNLALESEFEAVRSLLRDELGMPPEAVSIVPGNHDSYTRGSFRRRRFEAFLGEYASGDELRGSPTGERFPFVRLRDHVAFIGLTSAVPRPVLVASGEIGGRQLAALRRLLSHPEVSSRTPVILQHHPVHPYPSPVKTFMQGLTDRADELAILDGMARGLLLHGHIHRCTRRPVRTSAGDIEVLSAVSASLRHDDAERMGGFNSYEIDDQGVCKPAVHTLDMASGQFFVTDLTP